MFIKELIRSRAPTLYYSSGNWRIKFTHRVSKGDLMFREGTHRETFPGFAAWQTFAAMPHTQTKPDIIIKQCSGSGSAKNRMNCIPKIQIQVLKAKDDNFREDYNRNLIVKHLDPVPKKRKNERGFAKVN